MTDCSKPKGSETSAEQWLRQIGATSIRFLGDKREDGPPDYVIEYAGEEVAVEVTLVQHNDGWGNEKEIAFGRKLHDFISEVLRDENAPRWHALQVEYDEDEQGPPKTGKEHAWWEKRLKTELLSDVPAGTEREVQLMHPARRQGRGISLRLIRAGNEGGMALRQSGVLDITTDAGCLLQPTLTEAVSKAVCDKTRKVERARKQGSRAARYDRWWLVLDDDVMIVPSAILMPEERRDVEDAIRLSNQEGTWSKVVLVSRRHHAGDTECPPDAEALRERPKWYWPMWEAAEDAPLPRSP